MICLDANVLIEIIVGRKNAGACRDYINKTTEDLATTMLTVDLVMYYAEGKKLDTTPIEQFQRQFIWLPLVDADAEWAFRYFANKDFEDGLQIASAKREGCGAFATLDKKLAKKYAQELQIDLIA
jgi:predicted nucleic acid-binding protein